MNKVHIRKRCSLRENIGFISSLGTINLHSGRENSSGDGIQINLRCPKARATRKRLSILHSLDDFTYIFRLHKLITKNINKRYQ